MDAVADKPLLAFRNVAKVYGEGDAEVITSSACPPTAAGDV